MADLVESAREWGDRPALSCLVDGKKQVISFTDLCEEINSFSRGFLEMGLKKGDRVAVFSSNTVRWVSFSLGMNITGIINVPRGENASEEDMNFITEHSGARIAIVENEAVFKKFRSHTHKNIETVYSIEKAPSLPSIDEILERGRKSKKSLFPVEPDDTASIIYTSGTTGKPKGVMLSHYNIVSNITSLHRRVPVTPEDRAISALPAWHIFEWAAKLFWMLAGTECFYSKIPDLPQTFEEQKPTMMPSVPRIWEAFYKRIIRTINQEPALKRTTIKFLLSVAVDHARRKNRFDPLRILEAPFHSLFDKKAFAPLREKIGGRLRYALSGGGKLPHYLDDFFHAANIEILEGYGLTETSPIIAARTPGKYELYSVGKPLEGVSVRIVDPVTQEDLPPESEGLILVKGPNVMKGYYRDEEETKKVLVDGWFNTGDKGILSKKGLLTITGRYKETIVLHNVENVNPSSIEEELLKSPFITSAFIFDQESRYINALIVPNFDVLKEYCVKNAISFEEKNPEALLRQMTVRTLYEKEIRKLINRNPKFKSFEAIRNFELLEKDFTIGEEYTETMKLKRDIILSRNSERSSAMKQKETSALS
jgi:long-chain acyl-CoA synthetase